MLPQALRLCRTRHHRQSTAVRYSLWSEAWLGRKDWGSAGVRAGEVATVGDRFVPLEVLHSDGLLAISPVTEYSFGNLPYFTLAFSSGSIL